MKTIAVILALACSSCTLTVAPDGSRTWAMSGEEVGKALVVIAQK
jgi:hypothetical protein